MCLLNLFLIYSIIIDSNFNFAAQFVEIAFYDKINGLTYNIFFHAAI